jgi:hypothetical protein
MELHPGIQPTVPDHNDPRSIQVVAVSGRECTHFSGAANQMGTASNAIVECKVIGKMVTLKDGYCTAECIYQA